MRKTNDELYDDLIEQALIALRANEYGNSEQRAWKVRELVHLMDAYERGEDIVQAKLAMTKDDIKVQATVVRLRHHLGQMLDHLHLFRALTLLEFGPYVVGQVGAEIVFR